MALVASQPPDEGMKLCEGCGYILDGLPADNRCPECGKPAAQSTDPQLRRLPAWETSPSPVTFIASSYQVMVHPARFARHLLTRRDTWSSWWFAAFWQGVCALTLGLAVLRHAEWLELRGGWTPAWIPLWLITVYALFKVFSVLWIYLLLAAVTEVAGRLTAWEARMRGLRLPLVAVRRALRYHSVHLLPVSLLALATAWGYTLLLEKRIVTSAADSVYVYVLCAQVLAGAGYLFLSYWAMMRNIMYANR